MVLGPNLKLFGVLSTLRPYMYEGRALKAFNCCGLRFYELVRLSLLLLFAAGFSAAGQSSTEAPSADSAPESRASIEQVEAPITERLMPSALKIGITEQDYPAEGQTEIQRKEYSNLGVDIDLHEHGKEIEGAVHGIYQGTMQSETEQYFGLPEFYVGETRSSGSGVRLTFGRQKRHWSRFDEEFGMGIWQPQLRWDYLDPVQQGLTGAFFDYNINRNVELTFFMSPIFLPDQGPNFKLRDGQFESQNRWFWAPRTNVMIGSQRQPVGFDLQTPTLDHIVFQSSVGGNIHYQSRSTPLWAQLSYAYKPMNQLHIGWDCTECMDITFSESASQNSSLGAYAQSGDR